MAVDEDVADLFAVPDFGKTSRWLEELVGETSTALIGFGLPGALAIHEFISKLMIW